MIITQYGKRINPKYGFNQWYARAKPQNNNPKTRTEPSFSKSLPTQKDAIAETIRYNKLLNKKYSVKFIGRKDLDCSKGNC